MVCSNCKSTDIVTIQGQNFCLNCGRPVAPGETGLLAQIKPQPVEEPEPQVTLESEPENVVDLVEPEPREKALDEVAQPAIEQSVIAPRRSVNITSQIKTVVASVAVSATATAAPAMEPTVTSSPGAPAIKIVKRLSGRRIGPSSSTLTVAGASGQSAIPPSRLLKSQSGVRRISDLSAATIAPVRKTPKLEAPEIDPLAPAQDPLQSSIRNPAAAKVERVVPPKIIKMHFSDAITAALGAIGVAKGKRYGYVFGIFGALPLAFAARWLLGLTTPSHPNFSIGYGLDLIQAACRHITVFNKNMIIIFGVLGLYALVTSIVKFWAIGALSYGYSKEIDHRPLARRDWSSAGWNAIVSTAGNTIFGVLQAVAAFGLAIVADQQFGIVLGASSIAYMVVRFIVWMFAIVMFNRALGQSILAHFAIVLGGLNARQARKQASKLWVSTSGATFFAMLINMSVVSVFVIVGFLAVGMGAWLLQGLGSEVLHGWTIFALSLAAWIIVIHASLVFSVVLWLGIYRWAIGRSKLSTPTSLLSGRLPAARKLTPAMLMLLVGGLAIMALTYAAFTHADSVDHWYRQNIQSLS